MTGRVDLLTNASATGSATLWPGGFGSFFATGTFAGATLTLQVLNADAATYTAVGPDTTLVAAGGANFLLPPCTLRVLIAGGPPSAVYAYVVGINL